MFAATATGSALAWSGTVHPVTAATVSRAAVVPATPSEPPSARIGRTTAAARVTTVRTVAPAPAAKATAPTKVSSTRTTARTSSTRARSAPRVRPRPATTTHSITISRYVDSPGSQSAIDKCRLVLWTHSPLWLAGHNWCGYQWMAYVATGTVVHVTSGAAAGTYVVTGHKRLSRQSGSLPHLTADLVLQTCVGSGTGLTLLRRV